MSQERSTRLADFLYEAVFLKETPRSGFAFLGSGKESVAEHSYGAAIAGYLLGLLAGADAAHIALLCLFHDFHEAATGDFNYVNHRYDKCDANAVMTDACAGTGLSGNILPLWEEFEQRETIEARLARDADQLDMICSLRKQLCHGNPYAGEWLKTAVKRIATKEGQKLCTAIMATDPNHWWYDQVDESWWINRDG